MRKLYPELFPYRATHLAVDSIHRLYIEESGRHDGQPMLFLHGGPGGGSEAWHRQFFDPEHYRIVLFDQRGCGRSSPHAELRNNTTADLIEDIEKIRRHLDIGQWIVFGGSWGSTLALAYAQHYPEAVRGLILRGIFLCRNEEIAWFYQRGANHVFPDYWTDFLRPLPMDKRDDPLRAYHEILTGDDEVKRMAAAKAWSTWEGRTATLLPNDGVVEHFARPHIALSMARIEAHYFVNKAFLEPNQLLDRIHRLDGIPAIIVHGRYDMICPLATAWELHRAWSGSQLEIVANAGHSAGEPGIIDALVRATDAFAGKTG